MKEDFKSANACADLTGSWGVPSKSPPSQIRNFSLRSFGSSVESTLDCAVIAPQLPLLQAWNSEHGLSRRFLQRAVAYMEEHLGENFSLEELARAVGISRFHFSRLFRMSTGTSPMVFALHLRIERAKTMLLHGDRRACEIATTLGFFDQSHFSRTFRRMTGVSPGEYIRMCDATGLAT